MRYVTRFVVAGIALVATALLCISFARAGEPQADPQGPGNLTGVVFSSSDKPMSGFTLKLFSSQPIQDGGHGPKQHGLNDGLELFAEQQIGVATTDATGKFSFTNIPTGAYMLKGGTKSTGFIYTEVIIKPGETTDLGKIQLAKT